MPSRSRAATGMAVATEMVSKAMATMVAQADRERTLGDPGNGDVAVVVRGLLRPSTSPSFQAD